MPRRPSAGHRPACRGRPQKFLDIRHELSAPMRDVAPALHAAICQLCGGEQRVTQHPHPLSSLRLDAAFVVNYDQGSDQPWVEPHPSRGGSWHVDGDFVHYLDSPEAGLFFIVLWGDVELQQGPTYFSPDSIGHALRALRRVHPEGLSAKQLNSVEHNPKRHAQQALPCVGKAGDAFLMHPSMLHTSSQNIKRVPRYMRNDQVQLNAPFAFDPDDLCPVERNTLRCLGLPEAGGLPWFEPPAASRRCATDADTGARLPWKYKDRPSFATPAQERGLSATMYGSEAGRQAALAEGFEGARQPAASPGARL